MNSIIKKYSTAFTAGALLLSETEVVINSLNNYDSFLKGEEDFDVMLLPINAESSRKRIGSEIIKRLKVLPDSSFIELFNNSDAINKKLILFYAVCKSYPVILDFIIEIVVNKWNNLDLELNVEDFQSFLFIKADYHPELTRITDKTKYKAGQVSIKMLKELGMHQKGKLQKQEFEIIVLKAFSSVGDAWFLDLLFLNSMEKENIFEA